MKNSIPILMYHGLSNTGDRSLHRTIISKKQFDEQMSWLKANEYKTISLTNLLQPDLSEDTSKKVVITFDDGYFSYIDVAKPILQRLGYTAVLFLSTKYLNCSSYPEDLVAKDCMNPNDRPLTLAEVQELSICGWEIGSHAHTHNSLNLINDSLRCQELGLSIKIISEWTKLKPIGMAFPYGHYDSSALADVKARFDFAFTTHQGHWIPSIDRYRIPRLEITNADSLDTFEEKITSGYSSKLEWVSGQFKALVRKNLRLYDFFSKFRDNTFS